MESKPTPERLDAISGVRWS